MKMPLQYLLYIICSKIYLFGLAALDKFKRRLHEFPQYCASIASIPHFQAFPEPMKQVCGPTIMNTFQDASCSLPPIWIWPIQHIYGVGMESLFT